MTVDEFSPLEEELVQIGAVGHVLVGTWHTASLTHTYRPAPSDIPLKFLSGLVDSVVVHIDASALVTQTGAVSQVPGGQQAFLQEESEHVVAAAKSKNKSQKSGP
jgi:hypothetical protein